MIARCPTTRSVITHPAILAAANEFLGPYCERIQLHLTQTISIFPGQGAQIVGMGKDLYEQHAIAKELYDKADGILGFSLSKLCFEGPQEELNKTNIARQALLVTS